MVPHRLVLAPVVQLDPERATFTDMLDRYAISLRSRGLSTSTVEARLWGVRRFQEFTGEYPWNWGPRDVEDFTSALLSRPQPAAHSTIRGYHLMIKLFCEFLVNPAYDLSRADLVPCDGDENVGGVRAGRGGRGDLVAADADGDVAERAQGPDDLADAVAGGLLQVA